MTRRLPESVETRLLLARRFTYAVQRFRRSKWDFGQRRKDFYSHYWRQAAAEVGASVEDRGAGYFEVRRGSRSLLVQYHLLNLDTYFNKALVDDKAFVRDLVTELGFVSPRSLEYDLSKMAPAFDFLERVAGPCVVKPLEGAGGLGVTTGVNGRKRLVEASLAASNTLTLPRLMIEEQIPGESYRLLYLDGKLLHAVKRGRPTVSADGEAPIRALIDSENARRLSSPRIESISDLRVDLDVRYALADQGLSLNSVPGPGRTVRVKNVANQNSARDQETVTDLVHAAYHDLAEGVRDRLGAHLIGVDVMTEDLSRSPADGSGAVNEINIPPGLHYHELVRDREGLSSVGPTVLSYLLER